MINGTNNRTEYQRPAEAFPPGEYLADELEARGWKQNEFADIIRRPVKVVNEIIAGKKTITPDTAYEIAAALGTSPQYWLNLQSSFDLWRTEPPKAAETIAREAALRERFPVREMIKFGWLRETKNYDVLETQVFNFFDVRSIDEQPAMSFAARRNDKVAFSNLQEAWIYRVRHLASALQAPQYIEKKLRSNLYQLEALMIEPEEMRKIPQFLFEHGVRLVIVEPIPGSKIDGVCFWLDENSPVIGLTLKLDYIDNIWFNIWHEIEHVLRGDGKEVAVIDDFADGTLYSEDECEIAANSAAAEHCVSQKALADFVLRHSPLFATTYLIGFSKLMKRHPGIIAGQLQRKIKRPELFKKFQTRVRDILTSTALTDGYGHRPNLQA
jgi:HTH-type transcriptional regulator / antitoxin HigA